MPMVGKDVTVAAAAAIIKYCITIYISSIRVVLTSLPHLLFSLLCGTAATVLAPLSAKRRISIGYGYWIYVAQSRVAPTLLL